MKRVVMQDIAGMRGDFDPDEDPKKMTQRPFEAAQRGGVSASKSHGRESM
jgi:hypothetical protein